MEQFRTNLIASNDFWLKLRSVNKCSYSWVKKR